MQALLLKSFRAKFRFRKRSGGTNCNAEGQFVMFSRFRRKLFENYLSLFEKQSVFAKSLCTIINVSILMTADTISPSSPALSFV